MKNQIAVEGVLRLRFHLTPLLFALLLFACEPVDNRLGINLLPPGDSILAYSDTLYDLDMNMITPSPIVTSISADNASPGRVFLLGSKSDTLTGKSKAEIVSRLTITQSGIFGDNPEVDSVELSIYVTGVEGDTSLELRLSVYEFTGELEYDSVYYSDYSVEGKYDPEPLLERSFTPRAGKMHTFYITDEAYVERIRQAARDTVFQYDSLVKQRFPGLYLTTEQFTESGSYASVQMNSNFSRLGFRYLHDSISTDTATWEDYSRYYINFDERFTQTVNIFRHDKTGSGVEPYLDHPDTQPRIAYLQGMAGVNVRISLPEEILDLAAEGPVAVNRARLLLPVVPDTISGIPSDDFPPYLMLSNILQDGSTQVVFDYLVNPSSSSFGKLSRTFDVSAFVDPVYYYSFNIGMHVQTVLNGDISLADSDLLLFIRNPFLTGKNMKIWSNHSGPELGPKLELVYTRF